MIKNQEEYNVCKIKCSQGREKMEAQLLKMRERGYGETEISRILCGTERLVEKNRNDIMVYERLQKKDLTVLHELPLNKQLIALRIYLDISQAQLAQSLGIPEEQLARDEQHDYCGITMERYLQILRVLGIHLIPSYVTGDMEATRTIADRLLQKSKESGNGWLVGGIQT